MAAIGAANASSPNLKQSNAILGMAFMILGMFIFACADAIAKLLTADYHPFQIAWARMLGLIIMAFVFVLSRGPIVLRSCQPYLQIARGVCAIISASLFIFALKYVALADAVAVSFVAPFMVTILGAVFLNEAVGIRRWTAIIIGFIGTLIILRPGTGAVHPALFLIVLAALAFATRQVLSRSLSGNDGPATTLCYTGMVGFLLLSIPCFYVWQLPVDRDHLILFGLIAVFSAFGELMVIKALDVAQAVIVAPMQYSLLLWGTLSGYFIFQQLPDLWTWVGTFIIVCTGIYTFRRETYLAKQKLSR